MEVVLQVDGCHFNSTNQYMSAPSSPNQFGCDPYEFYITPKHFASSPLAPNSVGHAAIAEADFAFDFNFHLHKCAPPPELTIADELFYQGKILPLMFPLRLHSTVATQHIVAKNSDPFSASMAEETRKSRGRIMAHSSIASRSRKGSRSLSLLRGVSERFLTPLKGEGDSSSISSKKWCFKRLFLFRSASEGRATGDRNKDPLRKYTASCSSHKLLKKGCGAGGDELVSPHAMYAANRAASEEMKRKTALPYKEGIFNWLRFFPPLRGFGRRRVGTDNSSNSEKSLAAGSKSLPRLR